VPAYLKEPFMRLHHLHHLHHLHPLTAWIVALLAAAALTSGAGASVRAAPGRTRLPEGVTESAKVTLPETSIDGPGFHLSAIAWTGTDPAHHLNIRTGTDGLHFPNKTILSATSPVGPSLLLGPGEQPLTPVLGWTDANHSLHVEFNPPTGTNVTMHESSFAAPALTVGSIGGVAGTLLAWTGTDANHSLNVAPIISTSSGGLTLGKKTELRQFSSDAGPNLAIAATAGPDELVLGWSVRGTQRLNLAISTDGVHFTSALGAGLPETSATAPQFVQPNGSSSGCIAWTGTDAANHLNVQCTTQFPQFPDPAHTKTELSETALGGPGFIGNEIAWTGTDAAHHLNVAQLQGL
jgi:hypothetical protein